MDLCLALMCGLMSHPSRGGWIEIIKPEDYAEKLTSPTPHGVGGLKS